MLTMKGKQRLSKLNEKSRRIYRFMEQFEGRNIAVRLAKSGQLKSGRFRIVNIEFGDIVYKVGSKEFNFDEISEFFIFSGDNVRDKMEEYIGKYMIVTLYFSNREYSYEGILKETNCLDLIRKGEPTKKNKQFSKAQVISACLIQKKYTKEEIEEIIADGLTAKALKNALYKMLLGNKIA